ncbi:sensor domain-containing protein [Streptomyces sp. NPDC096040]|uniref:sensor histidine kinase n=1 Tax=Streptomyces sp. NPDC096040 TaxID=3155541 RepID=UPI00333200E6
MAATGECHAAAGSGPVTPGTPVARSGPAARFTLLGHSLLLSLASMLGAVLCCLWIASVALVPFGLGLPMTLLCAVAVRWFADPHRRWAGQRLGAPIARPYLPTPPGNRLTQLQAVLRDPASWRDCAWLLANSVAGWLTSGMSLVLFLAGVFYSGYPLLVAVTPPEVFREPFGFFPMHGLGQTLLVALAGPVILAAWYLSTEPLARLNARLMRSLLAPTGKAQLLARVGQLAQSRAEAVDAGASELRRIERDLHDGAQARLVSLGMNLGLAERVADDPEAVRRLLAEARASTAGALAELRDLVRGIHPPVLADRGLDGAVQALALANPVPTAVEVRLPGRLPAPVESAAYFAIAETLANAIKHAGARQIRISVEFTRGPGRASGELKMTVADDGRGGATIDDGGGLHGIARRLAAFDGALAVDSPSGGPTEVRMSLPCALS